MLVMLTYKNICALTKKVVMTWCKIYNHRAWHEPKFLSRHNIDLGNSLKGIHQDQIQD